MGKSVEGDSVKLKGEINFLLKDSQGNVREDRTIHNTVTAAGKGVVTALMLTDVGGTAFDAVAIGIGTPSTTALGSEITTSGGGRRSGANVTGSQTTTSTSNDTAQWVTTFTFSGGFAVTEEGVFNNASAGAGSMLASQNFSAINVISGDTLQVTHKVTLS